MAQQDEASLEHGLINFPTVFMVGRDGRIEHTVVSWSKANGEELAGKLEVDSPSWPGADMLIYKPG